MVFFRCAFTVVASFAVLPIRIGVVSLPLMGVGTHRPYEALGSIADQVLPVCPMERFNDQIILLGIAVLDQGALHCFLMWVGGTVDVLHRPWV